LSAACRWPDRDQGCSATPMIPVCVGGYGQCYAWSLLPASLQAVKGDAVFVRAELGVKSPTGAATSFKKLATVLALLKMSFGCHSLPKLQPERIQQGCGTKLPLQSFGKWVPNHLRIYRTAGTRVVGANYQPVGTDLLATNWPMHMTPGNKVGE